MIAAGAFLKNGVSKGGQEPKAVGAIPGCLPCPNY
eukprot:CAMPEP_0172310626 /NCGR_PEP_ID=MMETSP1058-20130122/12167_1 /TAXON_ID=83371 /ORGANISM="Detonula confervacea, Strain CCMP 353" /LENGTH=34 /DNA_ID= /DNA_START= /DNA_END= /DNA_ORIENTATION=